MMTHGCSSHLFAGVSLALLAVSSCSPAVETQPPPVATVTPKPLMTPQDLQSAPALPADHTIAYGDAPSQVGDLRVPAGAGPHPVVVLVHGGCFKEAFANKSDLAPMGDLLKADGIASWNIEYRRLYEPGSGWPGTYLDVGKAVDHLRTLAGPYNLDLDRVVIVGHSAGGHLAMWAAARPRLKAQSPLYMADALKPRGVINLAGAMDFSVNIDTMHKACAGPVVKDLLGGLPADVPERDADASAIKLVPLGLPQVLVWGEHEDTTPEPLAQAYVDAATKAGDTAQLQVIPNAGHFEVASTLTPAWPVVHAAIKSLLDGKLPEQAH